MSGIFISYLGVMVFLGGFLPQISLAAVSSSKATMLETEISDSIARIQVNFPASITTVAVNVSEIAGTAYFGVAVPHPIIDVSPGKIIEIPLEQGSSDYTVVLAKNLDMTKVYATFRVHNKDRHVLQYVNSSQNIQSEDPEIVALAQQLTVGFSSDYAKILAVHDWIANNIAYDFKSDGTPDKSIGQSSIEVLHSHLAICIGYSNLNAALLRSLGIPTKLLFAEGGVSHAWNEVFLNGQWNLDDTTWDAFGAMYRYDYTNKLWVRTNVENYSAMHKWLGIFPGFTGGSDHPAGETTRM
jgi:transglutaminase-like putative cysteine protease